MKARLYFQKLYYHHVGTPQIEDVVVCQDPEHRDYLFDAEVTEDGHYLAIHVSRGTEQKNLFYFRRLGDPRAPVVKLIDTFEATYRFLGERRPRVLVSHLVRGAPEPGDRDPPGKAGA